MLEIHTNPNLDDATTAHAAGYFEGHSMAMRLEQAAINQLVYQYNDTTILPFIKTNEAWMDQLTALQPQLPRDMIPFRHVALIYFWGLCCGRRGIHAWAFQL
jgi:hypothetical protein